MLCIVLYYTAICIMKFPIHRALVLALSSWEFQEPTNLSPPVATLLPHSCITMQVLVHSAYERPPASNSYWAPHVPSLVWWCSPAHFPPKCWQHVRLTWDFLVPMTKHNPLFYSGPFAWVFVYLCLLLKSPSLHSLCSEMPFPFSPWCRPLGVLLGNSSKTFLCNVTYPLFSHMCRQLGFTFSYFLCSVSEARSNIWASGR